MEQMQYLLVKAYGLRRSFRTLLEQMEEGSSVCSKMATRFMLRLIWYTKGNESGAGEFFRKLRDIGTAAVIVSDPALIAVRHQAPGLEIHLS